MFTGGKIYHPDINYNLRSRKSTAALMDEKNLKTPKYDKTLTKIQFPIKLYSNSHYQLRSKNSRNENKHFGNYETNLKTFTTESWFHKNLNGNTKHIAWSSENQQKETKSKNCSQNVIENFEQYCFSSTLHGLKYIGDNSLSLFERLFWALSFIIALGCACWFILKLLNKWHESPVIVTMSPTYTPIIDIPFPAITICNMNQASKEKVKLFLNGTTDEDKLNRVLLEDFCYQNGNSNTSLDNSEEDDITAEWDAIRKFMIQMNPSCNQMLKMCKWSRKAEICDNIFNPVVTDEGICCGFNKIHRNYIFKNPADQSDLNITYPYGVGLDWTPENGYRLEDSNLNVTPFRSVVSGSLSGLTLVLNADVDDYYCSSTAGIGFKIVIHNPVETPKLSEYGFFLSPGQETRVVITPNLNVASQSIRSVDPEKRKCYFADEKKLTYYRTYTQRNCDLECESKLIESLCKCVPYHLPKNKSTKVCGRSKKKCINDAGEKLESDFSIRAACDCMPSCFDVTYSKEQSTTDIDIHFQIRPEYTENSQSLQYFKKNMAIVHFYFLENQFNKYIKSELYGFSEFLSNIGGLLGLFMGFSFISVVEIFYFLFIRIFFYKRKCTKKLKNIPFAR